MLQIRASAVQIYFEMIIINDAQLMCNNKNLNHLLAVKQASSGLFGLNKRQH